MTALSEIHGSAGDDEKGMGPLTLPGVAQHRCFEINNVRQ